MTLAERFAKMNGIEWHDLTHLQGYEYTCECGVAYNVFDPRCIDLTIAQHNKNNPTFSDAKSILEVMQKRDDFGDFLIQKVGKLHLAESDKLYAYVEIYYVYNPDKLLTEAIKWCEQHQKEGV